MSDINNVHPPEQFKYKNASVRIKNYFQFTCDNRIYFSKTKHIDLKNQLYQFDVEILSPIDDLGLALDFNEVDKIYDEYIAPYLDNQLVNATLPTMNTTAENIALWIWDQFARVIPEGNKLEKLTFYENKTQGLVLTAEDMQ
ncbi:6-carboxytetrahydropterin synthase [Staphylococcus sp. 18_1_E_LY]|uniref:6-carboxy-5,6,7,8-tetrahydropterin synthase n=1 Tax=Staphylococcus lloydii TaxID=2781774 RepID=A0A7T1F9R1_9STAP|nr:6-carboxytetrahydropterin synthase [Staphylococcus lloydii]MBF7020201.1 6-carboxytetrahydropterin synthase [Staphylococcus lloydii]MBF7027884.1 6-carboxytetrahydropterin synthase [Staphylococcus lloydii]QPM75555.1 6-carboxytetrahydropterin synthase [Staphylococcus lloydii]